MGKRTVGCLFLGVAGLVAALAVSGCASLGGQDEPELAVSIHEFSKPSRDTEPFILQPEGGDTETKVWIRRIPLLHSKYIPAMEVTRGPRDMPAIKMSLNRHGQYMWTAIQAEYAGRPVALLVDGKLEIVWQVPAGTGEFNETVVIEGPWSMERAAEIAAQARKNYEIFN